ncbi:hypothetical protein B0O99DRAFT_649756 [Bisporella sp. PMI_857]|nr:hypothetical protein B0O99DRAFT_649756 [Bisporella sp. PMI_857]
MTTRHMASRPLTQCLRNTISTELSSRAIRPFSISARVMRRLRPPAHPRPSHHCERTLIKSGILPIGSRRRRAAMKSSENIPFELLPYQCFQEARKVLSEDREEKLKAIKKEKLRISNLLAQDSSSFKNGEQTKETRLASMRKYLEYLKIQADINDPLIKKRFEDGEGLYHHKPIYRYLAHQKWRSYQWKIVNQRIHQLGVVPDFLPHFEPTADVRLAFGRRNVQPGEYVDSRVSEIPVRLKCYCHGCPVSLPCSQHPNFTDRHISAFIACHKRPARHPWLPPFAQKGSPYHRYITLKRDHFKLKALVQNNKLKPIGRRAGIEGSDIEFKRKKVEPLKRKQKPRGWEAKHSSAKYAPLFKGRGQLFRTIQKQNKVSKRRH